MDFSRESTLKGDQMFFIYILFGVISTLLAVFYKVSFNKVIINDVFKNKKKYFCENATMLFIFISGSIGVYYLEKKLNISYFASFEFLVLLFTLWLISEIDIKMKIIPNQLVLFLFFTRIILLWYVNSQERVFVEYIYYSPLIGLIIGGGVLLVSKILSRNGIGLGDVKLFSVIGFFVGQTGIISVLFYTFILTAIVGVALLLFKKMSINESLPLAPFSFIGLTIYFITNYVNW